VPAGTGGGAGGHARARRARTAQQPLPRGAGRAVAEGALARGRRGCAHGEAARRRRRRPSGANGGRRRCVGSVAARRRARRRRRQRALRLARLTQRGGERRNLDTQRVRVGVGARERRTCVTRTRLGATAHTQTTVVRRAAGRVSALGVTHARTTRRHSRASVPACASDWATRCAHGAASSRPPRRAPSHKERHTRAQPRPRAAPGGRAAPPRSCHSAAGGAAVRPGARRARAVRLSSLGSAVLGSERPKAGVCPAPAARTRARGQAAPRHAQQAARSARPRPANQAA
jgi:hypothetical protein